MRATGPTSGSKSTVKIGATKDGTHRRRARHLLSAGRRVPGLADPRRRRLQLRALRHPEPALGRLRRRLQPLQGRGLSRAGRADRRLRGRVRARRSRRSAEDGSARVAPEERRQGRHQGRARPGVSAHRLHRDAGSGEEHPITTRRRSASCRAGASPPASGSTPAANPRRRSTSPRTATSSSPRAIPISAARARHRQHLRRTARHRLPPRLGPDRRHRRPSASRT